MYLYFHVFLDDINQRIELLSDIVHNLSDFIKSSTANTFVQ